MTWRPTASLKQLEQRSELLRRTRQFFYSRGFCEVQTPVLGRDTVVDRHLDPIVIPGDRLGLAAGSPEHFLQTSPEFSMKRLVAAGMEAIFQIGPAFRAGESGALHNLEFTMLEWYRAGHRFEDGLQFLSDLAVELIRVEGCDTLTYAEAMQIHAGIDVFSATVTELATDASKRFEVSADWSDDRDDWFDLFFSELVQPSLGGKCPVILTHYPASQSALAKLSVEDPRTAERYELFYRGVELANGYHELQDAEELELRNQRVNRQRASDGKHELPVESEMLRAMRDGLPACCGCALGLDRLQMVTTGASNIAEVLCFPIEHC
ncbi:MAG: EF-P lysine aminoacylase EpmA [Planctomycetota bacterium]